jgi:hypothetical protein
MIPMFSKLEDSNPLQLRAMLDNVNSLLEEILKNETNNLSSSEGKSDDEVACIEGLGKWLSSITWNEDR